MGQGGVPHAPCCGPSLRRGRRARSHPDRWHRRDRRALVVLPLPVLVERREAPRRHRRAKRLSVDARRHRPHPAPVVRRRERPRPDPPSRRMHGQGTARILSGMLLFGLHPARTRAPLCVGRLGRAQRLVLRRPSAPTADLHRRRPAPDRLARPDPCVARRDPPGWAVRAELASVAHRAGGTGVGHRNHRADLARYGQGRKPVAVR